MVDFKMTRNKRILLYFSVLVVVASFGWIFFGASVIISLDKYADFVGSEYLDPPRIMIAVGVILFLIAIFGCLGAYFESYRVTVGLGVVLGVIFLFQLGACIACFVMSNQYGNDLDRQMKKTRENYLKDSGDKIAWDKVQNDFDCCGLYNALEWRNVTGDFPPKSCCSNSVVGNCTYSEANDKECWDCVNDFFQDSYSVISGFGVALTLDQLAVIALVFAMAKDMGRRKGYNVV